MVLSVSGNEQNGQDLGGSASGAERFKQGIDRPSVKVCRKVIGLQNIIRRQFCVCAAHTHTHTHIHTHTQCPHPGIHTSQYTGVYICARARVAPSPAGASISMLNPTPSPLNPNLNLKPEASRPTRIGVSSAVAGFAAGLHAPWAQSLKSQYPSKFTILSFTNVDWRDCCQQLPTRLPPPRPLSP